MIAAGGRGFGLRENINQWMHWTHLLALLVLCFVHQLFACILAVAVAQGDKTSLQGIAQIVRHTADFRTAELVGLVFTILAASSYLVGVRTAIKLEPDEATESPG